MDREHPPASVHQAKAYFPAIITRHERPRLEHTDHLLSWSWVLVPTNVKRRRRGPQRPTASGCRAIIISPTQEGRRRSPDPSSSDCDLNFHRGRRPERRRLNPRDGRPRPAAGVGEPHILGNLVNASLQPGRPRSRFLLPTKPAHRFASVPPSLHRQWSIAACLGCTTLPAPYRHHQPAIINHGERPGPRIGPTAGRYLTREPRACCGAGGRGGRRLR